MRNNLVDCDAPATHGDYTHFFRTWLAAEMRRRNVRAEQLARCSLVHRSTISRVLSGDRSPTLDTVARLSAAFHIDLALVGPWSGGAEAGRDVARGT